MPRAIRKRLKRPVRSRPAARLSCVVRPLLAWFGQNARALPWRRTRDPYAIWVSEIMLQQTQVSTVIAYWERWMRELPTLKSLAEEKPARVLKLWEGLGYYTRARNLHKAAQVVVSEHGGQFPEEFEDVLALPGIGRYTAGAICSIAFNQPAPILDGNVIRVLCRLFGLHDDPRGKKTNAKLWAIAQELVFLAAQVEPPMVRRSRRKGALTATTLAVTNDQSLLTSAATMTDMTCSLFNQSLMELGALVCTPRQPKCGLCPLRTRCVARRDGLVDRLPNLSKRAAPTQRHFIAFVIEDRGRFLVRQRPAGVVNAGLWEFPNLEAGPPASKTRGSRRDGAHSSSALAKASQSLVTSAATDHGRLLRLDSLSSFHPGVKSLAWSKLGLKLASVRPLRIVKHSITRYRITLEAHQAQLESPVQENGDAGRWLPPNRLAALAFTSAHRKLLDAALARLDANGSAEPARNVADDVRRRTERRELLGESASSRRRLRSLVSSATGR